jgi:hypothetical protein
MLRAAFARIWGIMTPISFLALAFLAAADDPLAEVEIVPVDGPSVKVAKFSAEGGVVRGVRHLGRGDPAEWRIRDVASIRFPSKPPLSLSGVHLRLADEEAVRCSAIEKATADEFTVRGNQFGAFRVPAELMIGAVIDPDADESISERAAEWMKKPRDRDAMLFKNFDESKGSFLGIDDGTVMMEVDGMKRTTPRSQVLAVAFDPQLLQPKKSSGIFAFVRLADGTRLRASTITASSDRPEIVSLETVVGPKIDVKRDQLVDASIRNGRLVYLSDLKESSSETVPYLDDSWPIQRDRAATGVPMRLGGKTFDKGLGVRSGTTISFPVAGFARFDSTIGLDDSAGPLGHAVFVVLVDGKEAVKEVVKAGDAPKPISAPLAGARSLTLRVDFGLRGDVQDFADWGDARLVK